MLNKQHKMEQLRLYTAWAVALGEIKHWNNTLNSYKQNSASLDDGYDDVFFFVTAAHAFDSHIPVNFGGDMGFVPDFGGGFGGGAAAVAAVAVAVAAAGNQEFSVRTQATTVQIRNYEYH